MIYPQTSYASQEKQAETKQCYDQTTANEKTSIKISPVGAPQVHGKSKKEKANK
jgi:hypothetical protein